MFLTIWNCLLIFAFLEIMNGCVCLSTLLATGANFLFSEKPENACGVLSVNGVQLWITERQYFDPFVFESVKNIHGGSLNITRNECQIEICGYERNAGDGDCFDYFQSVDEIIDVSEQFEMTSTSCGCQKHRPEVCRKKCKEKTVSVRSCGTLYQESECNNCLSDGIELGDGELFHTNNSEQVRSFNVRAPCVIRYTSYGNVGVEYPTPINITYDVCTSRLHPNYYKGGQDYLCDCNYTASTTPNGTITSTHPPEKNFLGMPLPVSISITVALMISCALVIGAYLRFRMRRRPKLVLTKEQIKQILNGDSSDDSGNTQLEKIPIITLPYDESIEIDSKDVKFDTSDLSTVIGEGAFGMVFRGQLYDQKTKKYNDVAVKTVNPNVSTMEDLQSLINEIKVMAYVGSHENIVGFLGAVTVNLKHGEVYSIMELYLQGNLKSLLQLYSRGLNVNRAVDVRKASEGYCSDDSWDVVENSEELIQSNSDVFNNLLKWSKEIAQGMEYLTEKGVLHIDLATRNVLLSSDLTAKISDFGLSRKLYDKPYFRNKMGFIPVKWIALESLSDNVFSVKSDIWAYSITLWEIFTLGSDPYPGMDSSAVFTFLQNGGRPSCPKFSPEDVFEQIKLCWNSDPNSRPTFVEMKTFFKSRLKL